MPPKKQQVKEKAPDNLKDTLFYGLELDEQQKIFRDAIWSKDNDIVFCNAKAGTGKTLLAVATAKLLIDYGKYDGLVYIISPTQEQKVGFLPGGIESKEAPYSEPLYDALLSINEDPLRAIKQVNPMNEKNGTAWIDCRSHIYLRGTNLKNKVVILDEMQNYYFEEAKKTLTRIHDTCKTVCIGHNEQVDIYKNPQNSGFTKYLEHFRNEKRCVVCELSTNYRGWVSTHADNLL